MAPPIAPALASMLAPTVAGQPDDALIAWFVLNPEALDMFSVAEREHALAILGGAIPLTLAQRQKRRSMPLDKAIEGAVADYLRGRMANGALARIRERDAARAKPEVVKTQRDFDNGDAIGGWVLVRTSAGEWGVGLAVPADDSPGWRVSDVGWCASEAEARECFAFELGHPATPVVAPAPRDSHAMEILVEALRSGRAHSVMIRADSEADAIERVEQLRMAGCTAVTEVSRIENAELRSAWCQGGLRAEVNGRGVNIIVSTDSEPFAPCDLARSS
jgi:hypothetical protein